MCDGNFGNTNLRLSRSNPYWMADEPKQHINSWIQNVSIWNVTFSALTQRVDSHTVQAILLVRPNTALLSRFVCWFFFFWRSVRRAHSNARSFSVSISVVHVWYIARCVFPIIVNGDVHNQCGNRAVIRWVFRCYVSIFLDCAKRRSFFAVRRYVA